MTQIILALWISLSGLWADEIPTEQFVPTDDYSIQADDSLFKAEGHGTSKGG